MDPFSVATGGAGLASLGITICNGLLTYCINFRSRGDDLAILSQRTRELKDSLRQLEGLKQRGSGVEDKVESSLRECCNACTLCLQEIDIFDRKYLQQSQPFTLKDHGTAIARKFQYPFRKGKLDELRHQLHELQVVLSNQLLLLNSDLTIDLHRLTTTESETIRTEIAKHSDRLFSVVSSTGPEIQKTLGDNLSRVGEALERRLENLEELITASFDRHHHKSRRGSDEYNYQNTAISEPKQHLLDHGGTLIPGESMFGLNCYCPWTKSGSHQSTCVYSFRSQKRRKVLTGRILLFSLMFKLKIEAQYRPDAFPWDFQIYSNLSVTTVVPDSPVWRVLDAGSVLSPLTPKELNGKCQRALRTLHQLYSSGKYQPTDVDQSNRNLFHLVLYQLFFLAGDEDDCMLVVLQFIKGLVQMGMPINQVGMYETVPLLDMTDYFLYFPRRSRTTTILVKGLIELGAELLVSDRNPLSGLGGLSLLSNELRRETGITIPLEYGELSRAILRQSEGEVRQLLSTSKMSILEKGPSGETPLHLAAGWTRGIKILLEHVKCEEVRNVVDAEDCQGYTALSYALTLRKLDCAVLLVQSGAYIDLEDTLNIERCPSNRYIMSQGDETIRFLTEMLARQRKQLLFDANEWLLVGTTAHASQILPHQMLQEEAFEVVRDLRNKCPAKEWPRPRPGSVYHAGYMSASLAKALYDVGFDRTNVFFHGFSPLMTINLDYMGRSRGLPDLLDLIYWFVDHGADLGVAMPWNADSHDPSMKPETSEFSLMQRCAFWLGNTWNLWNRTTTRLSSPEAKRIGNLLRITEVSPRDPCVCLCTGRGCSRISVFIRGLLYHNHLRLHRNGRFSQFASMDNIVFHLHDRIQCKQVASQYFVDVLRAITFEILEMRHVCCSYDVFWGGYGNVGQTILDGEFLAFDLMDPDEIMETQQEDRYRAERLEELMVEFEEAYKPDDESFESFYFSYYLERMKCVRSERDVLTPEDSLRIRETGVILDGDSNWV